MKKKFIAVYALIGVLALGSTTLTSCVDDNESASVTAVRDAKAAQLNALANYKNAQAESEKIVQAAEAAIKEAQAEYLKIQNEMENLKLQEAQATLSIDIETAKAEAEAALIRQQIVLEQAKADLILAAGQADAAVQTKISQLLGAANAIMYGGEYFIGNNQNYWYDENTGQGGYTTYYIAPSASIAGVDGLQSQLLNKKAEQITVKYNLEDTKRIMADLLTEERADSAANEALLAAYNEYKTTSREEAEQAAAEAFKEITPLQSVRDDAYAALNEAANKSTAAHNVINGTEVRKFFMDGLNLNVDVDNDGMPDVSLYPYYEREAADEIETFITFEDGTSSFYSIIPDSKFVLKADDLTEAIASKDREIEVAKADVEKAKKNRDERLADDNTTYKSLLDARDDAKEAWDDEKSESNRIDYENAMNSVTSYEAAAEKLVTDAEEVVQKRQDEKTVLTDFQTLMTGEAYKTYENAYNSYIDTVKARVDAYVPYSQADHNLTVQQTLASDLSTYAQGLTDWASLISGVTTSLNENKEKIEKLVAGLYSGTETGADMSEAARQDAIDVIAKQIEALETRIAQMQAQYDGYMAEVEALINGETGLPEVPDTPTTDTPAEGEGEETPAE